MESALATDRRQQKWKTHAESGEESSEAGSIRSRASRTRRVHSKSSSKLRTRSGTTSSTQTSTPTTVKTEVADVTPSKHTRAAAGSKEAGTPTQSSFLEVEQDEQSTPEIVPSPVETEITLQEPDAVVGTVRTTLGLTDESDTDFQSAYSTSPRGSYGSLEGDDHNDVLSDHSVGAEKNIEDRLSAPPKTRRERVSSTATAIVTRDKLEA